MRLKPGVDWKGVDPGVWAFLGIVAVEHRAWTDTELWITSLRRLTSPWPTRHVTKPGELVTAADVRRHYLDDVNGTEAFCRMLQVRFGEDVGVMLEPEWLSPEHLELRGGVLNVDPHIHFQLKRSDWPRF